MIAKLPARPHNSHADRESRAASDGTSWKGGRQRARRPRQRRARHRDRDRRRAGDRREAAATPQGEGGPTGRRNGPQRRRKGRSAPCQAFSRPLCYRTPAQTSGALQRPSQSFRRFGTQRRTLRGSAGIIITEFPPLQFAQGEKGRKLRL